MDSLIIVRRIIFIIVDLIILLLAARFALLLVNASSAAPFAQVLYSITSPFMRPFEGIFPMRQMGVLRFDWSIFFAIVIYAAIGYLLGRLMSLLLPVRRTTVVRAPAERRETGVEEEEEV